MSDQPANSAPRRDGKARIKARAKVDATHAASAGESAADSAAVISGADSEATPEPEQPVAVAAEVSGISDTPDHSDDEGTSDDSSSASRPSTAVLAVGAGAEGGGIEVGGLQSNQISVLQEQHAKGLIEVQRKASELKVDIQALDQTLESLTSQARTANDAGVNITATHTQNTSLGQTEIIVGNTQRAASGKVAPIWSGFDNNQLRTGLIIAAAVAAGVLLAALFS